MNPDPADEQMPYCPAMPGMGPHSYQPYFDVRTLTSVLFCFNCGDQKEVLPDTPSMVTNANAAQIPGVVNPSGPMTAPLQPAHKKVSPLLP